MQRLQTMAGPRLSGRQPLQARHALVNLGSHDGCVDNTDMRASCSLAFLSAACASLLLAGCGWPLCKRLHAALCCWPGVTLNLGPPDGSPVLLALDRSASTGEAVERSAMLQPSGTIRSLRRSLHSSL